MANSGHPEARIEKRFQVRFDADITTDWQQGCRGEITNLSLQGIRVEGTRELVDKVFTNFNPPKGTPRSKIQLTFATGQEVGQPAGSVTVGCQTIYVRRISQERYQIGMHFVEITESSMTLLERLILWLEQYGVEDFAPG